MPAENMTFMPIHIRRELSEEFNKMLIYLTPIKH